jgi:hypothetical protein
MTTSLIIHAARLLSRCTCGASTQSDLSQHTARYMSHTAAVIQNVQAKQWSTLVLIELVMYRTTANYSTNLKDQATSDITNFDLFHLLSGIT